MLWNVIHGGVCITKEPYIKNLKRALYYEPNLETQNPYPSTHIPGA